MMPALFDIWEDLGNGSGSYHWRAQLVGYIGSFPSREKAESFVAATKKFRAMSEQSVAQPAPTRKSK
jgi:hypothetical protein